MRFTLFYLICFISFHFSVAQKPEVSLQLDSIYALRDLSRNQEKPIKKRLYYAEQASLLSHQLGIDSTLLISNRNLSVLYYDTDNYIKYKDLNKANLRLAKRLKDSSALAVANHNLALYFHDESQSDSAYFYYSNALKLYDKLKNNRKKAEVLLNVADLQETEKDYIGSEENAVKAIRLNQSFPKTERILDQLWILNNLLGVISVKLKSYDKALEYHEKCIDISNDMKNGYYNRLYSVHNVATIYRMKGDLDKAIELYLEVINEPELKQNDPSFYAQTLGNLSYAQSLRADADFSSIEGQFLQSYAISDSLQDQISKLGVTIDISKFYLANGKDKEALKFANESYDLSVETLSNDVKLEALMLLSKLNKGEKGKVFLKEHIRLSDSLLNIERNVRNKFARIELETDQLEAENERISQQRMWLLIVSAVLLVTLFLLYVIITQRAKNKELQFEKDQQKANEEIYNLMLSQQDKVDEARANEKKRISQEMHDGILGRLFGTRLSLDSLNFSEGKEAIQSRSNYINELKTIEDDIRKISHDLNTDFVAGSGFMDIVSELIEKQTKAYQLKYTYDYTDDVSWESVSNKNKINIYRIIQESLQNIYKHAEAETVKISFELKNNVILLAIVDDGKGFDVNKSKKGIGIKNINARVADLEGTVDIQSEIGSGATIHIKIPYKTNP